MDGLIGFVAYDVFLEKGLEFLKENVLDKTCLMMEITRDLTLVRRGNTNILDGPNRPVGLDNLLAFGHIV